MQSGLKRFLEEFVAGDLIVDPGNHFRGRSEHSLDGKGRLNIPTRFREVLGVRYDDRLMVYPWNKCLKVYPLFQWEEMESQLDERQKVQPDLRKMIRYIIGGVVECPLDKQGRILLPPKLREEGGINKEVVITGVRTYFEIRDKQIWEADNKFSTAEFENFDHNSGLL